MTATTEKLWVREHGEEFAVPEQLQQILLERGFEDESWSNDACPVFRKTNPEGKLLVVWCDHPDEAQREAGGKRFVFEKTEPTGETILVAFATNDAAEMVQYIKVMTMNPLDPHRG